MTTPRQLTITECECRKCAHRWMPRTELRPAQCPKCHSAGWDRPRRPKKEEKES